MQKRTVWLQRSVPHKQDDIEEFSILTKIWQWLVLSIKKKDFDIEPHEWILKVLNILNLSPVIITFQKYNMERLHSNLWLIYGKKHA